MADIMRRDDRDAMKIAEIVDHLRVLEAERRERYERARHNVEAEEFERIYV